MGLGLRQRKWSAPARHSRGSGHIGVDAPVGSWPVAVRVDAIGQHPSVVSETVRIRRAQEGEAESGRYKAGVLLDRVRQLLHERKGIAFATRMDAAHAQGGARRLAQTEVDQR